MSADLGLAADYGRCPCGGTYAQRPVTVKMTLDDDEITIERLPQGACPACGRKVYKAALLEDLEDLFQGRRLPQGDTGFGLDIDARRKVAVAQDR